MNFLGFGAKILIFDHMYETSIRSIFIMILAWQANQNLSIISESTNICEGQFKKMVITKGLDLHIYRIGCWLILADYFIDYEIH
jgi:hypothetical protein